MTADVTCRVERIEPIPVRYPLAHRSGVHAMVNMLEAGRHWSPLTRRCRDAVRTAYLTALRDAADGSTIPLPQLVGDLHPATVRALTRRGLVADGALTALGVETYRWAGKYEDRSTVVAQPVGGVL